MLLKLMSGSLYMFSEQKWKCFKKKNETDTTLKGEQLRINHKYNKI